MADLVDRLGTVGLWGEAREEILRLRAEVAELRAVVETKVHGIHVGSDGLYMGLSGGAAMVMAEMLAEQYKQGGGINYIEMRFESKESMPGQRFLVTVNRADAKTPHELRVEVEAERDRLRAELAKHQESEFHPDWSMLEATRASLREHMEIIRGLRAELAFATQLPLQRRSAMRTKTQ